MSVKSNVAQKKHTATLSDATSTADRAYLSGEVLEDSSTVHSCCGSYTAMAGCASLQVPVDTTHGELGGDGKKKDV